MMPSLMNLYLLLDGPHYNTIKSPHKLPLSGTETQNHYIRQFLLPRTYAVPCDPPSDKEITDAIRKLRNNKALGEDGVPDEIFKSCVDTLENWLHEVIEPVWRNEAAPDDWGILVPIVKKGDNTRCENYRGISLIYVAEKIFAIVLLRRFSS
ncbi:hypothetical protein SprV_1002829200 [Sparganum proliferum]